MAEEKVCTYRSLGRRKICVSFLSVERKIFFGKRLFVIYTRILSHGPTDTSGPGPSHCVGSKIPDTTICTTPLDERSAHRRDLYLITHNIHTRQISNPPPGFEPAIPASEQPQTHDFDGTASGIDIYVQ
jgi:hypothetical protein